MNDHKTRGVARRTEPSCHSRISKIHARRDRGGGGGEGSSGCVDGDGKLLLEIEVTKSLSAGASRRIGRVRDEIEEDKGHVEVTIVRPLLTPGESSCANERSREDAPTVTLSRYDEDAAVVTKRSEAKADCRTSRCSAVTSSLRRPVDPQRQRETKAKLSKSSDTEQRDPAWRHMESERISTIGNISPVDARTSGNDEAIQESPPLLIELGALHKILDRLRPDDLESTSAWYSSEPCCREIVQRFRNLLREWASDRERLDQCTTMDHTLTKCQNCGVIRCSEMTQSRNRAVHEEYRKKIVAERETDSRSIGTTMDSRESNVTKLVKNSSGHTIRHRSEKVPGPREKIVPKNKRIPVSSARISAAGTTSVRPVERDTTTNGVSTIVNPVIDGTLGLNATPIKKRNRSANMCRTNVEKPVNVAYHSRWVDKNRIAKNFSLMEALVCPGRDNADADKETPSSGFADKPRKLGRELFREDTFERRRSFDLYGSRDVDFHRNWDFLSSDGRNLKPERENVPESKTKHVAKTVILGSFDTSRQSIVFSERSDQLSRVRGSDESSFGSSSAENLIREWMNSGCKIEPKDNRIQNEDFSREIRADTSLPDVRNVTARMTEAIQKFSDRSPSLQDDPLHEASNIDSAHCPDEKPSVKHDNTVTIARGPTIVQSELSRISTRVSEAIWNSCIKNRVSVSVSTEMPLKMKKKDSNLTVVSSSHLDPPDVSVQNFERFERQILYDEVSSRDAVSQESLTTSVTATKVLPLYRKIIESNEKMDWESFERLVTVLHPAQRELWCDICKAVSNEAKRIANETGATTEVCIEINPRAGGNEAELRLPHDDEITFELDMTLRDFGGIFGTKDRPAAFDGTREEDKTEQ